jgi:hypothetical protein
MPWRFSSATISVLGSGPAPRPSQGADPVYDRVSARRDSIPKGPSAAWRRAARRNNVCSMAMPGRGKMNSHKENNVRKEEPNKQTNCEAS